MNKRRGGRPRAVDLPLVDELIGFIALCVTAPLFLHLIVVFDEVVIENSVSVTGSSSRCVSLYLCSGHPLLVLVLRAGRMLHFVTITMYR